MQKSCGQRFVCEGLACGLALDRDVNTAKNILKRALKAA
ncbi:MAG: transposase [Firmicutes bacterium]|nr:transposase [Bacillota bacterium]